MSTLPLRIITPERTLFSGEARMVSVPGTEGDFGVLPGHSPFISSLRPGVINVEREGEAALRLVVTQGVAEVTPDRCIILTEEATPLENITLAAAQATLQEAEADIANALNDEQRKSATRKRSMAEAVVMALR